MSATAPGLLPAGRGNAHALGAFVVGAAFDRAGTQAAFALGDGTLRVAAIGSADPWASTAAHDGAAMAVAADAGPTGFVSGGDDGRLVRVGSDGTVSELAAFGGKWVEQVATYWNGKAGVVACAAGKLVTLFAADGTRLRTLEHPSTVTGLAFDSRGKRVAASHYNGASLWFVNSTAEARRLAWKGSHTAVALHPGAEAVVSAMQENALHGWRLPDAHDMRMSGYPTRPETLGFTASGKWLASSGAEAIVLWPFFGGGPMGKPPLELAGREGIVCTRVACHPSQDVVAAGYADGTVLLAEIATRRVLPVASGGHGPISALAWAPAGGWLGFGTEEGFAGLIDLTAAR